MALSFEEARKAITERKGGKTISRAILHQNRLRFHVQTELTPYVMQPTSDFLAFVKNVLPHDKYKLFLQLFRYPVKTNEITSICFDKLSRIFDGRNPANNYQFTDSEAREDWEEYRLQRLNEPMVWQTRGWEYFQTEINSVLVVDLPEEQDSELPRPYFYWLPIERVLAYESDREKGVMEYIIFRQKHDRIVVLDDERYRVFRNDHDNLGDLLVEAPHDLGYCPARFFWNTAINLREPDVKASPLTKELDALDWYLFYAISKRHLDMYGSYPIYSGYEKACDFSNSETGDYCDGGFLKNRQGQYLFDSAGMLMRCPKCGEKRIAGVGTFVEVPIPGENQPDLRNPVQMLTVDRDSLEYNVEESNRLKEEIINSVVGQSEEITQREAFNEQQIKAAFESQTTVLSRVKKGFEEAQQFVDSTVCRLRYGDRFISANINYGTEFYIYDIAELRERYKMAKESGASENELDSLQRQIVETEYRHNPAQLRRMLLLSDIEPYVHMTRDEVLGLQERNLVSAEDMQLKLNFSNYIRRFERENMNVLEFGRDIDYDKKIGIITDRLREYARADIQRNQL